MGSNIEYIGTTEAARLLQMTGRRVVGLCTEGKLSGAFRSGRNWKIPVNSIKICQGILAIHCREELGSFLFGVLILYILLYCLPAHITQCSYIVTGCPQSPSPETVAFYFRMPVKEDPRGTSLQILDYICYTVFRFETDKKMNMLRHDFHFLNHNIIPEAERLNY